jgi:serine phosphatase RsbU (regulator of sigma subunit)
VAPHAALAFNFARMHKRALLRQTIENDLVVAGRVQQALLSSEPPTIPGYRFFHRHRPALNVGGDYFNYFPLSGGRQAIVVADVSGKGISAALMSAKVGGQLKILLEVEPSLSEVLTRLNQECWEDFERAGINGKLVTLLLAVLDPHADEVTFLNAGHMPPLLRRADGTTRQLSPKLSSLALGVELGEKFKPFRVKLTPGDSLLLYSDGITDAENAAGEHYGFPQLAATIRQSPGDALRLGARVFEDLERFVAGNDQSDDICLLCFGREALGAGGSGSAGPSPP